MTGRRFYEEEQEGRRVAPAALRNLEPIAEVLSHWLPKSGRVLEIASGTGQHARAYAERFPTLIWQPSDTAPEALSSIEAWGADGPPNLLPPLSLDVSTEGWPAIVRSAWDGPQTGDESGPCDAILCMNMVHISPWSAALGLIAGASTVLRDGGALILYGPWLQAGVETAPSNLAFDQQLRQRDPEWGLRRVEDFAKAACAHGFALEQTRAMPANNLMLLFRLGA